MYPTFDQIRGPLERVLLVGLAYAAAKEWIAKEWVADIAVLLLAVASGLYGWYTTWQSVIASRAAKALPEGTLIATTEEIAKATPGDRNVLSHKDMKIEVKDRSN